MTARSGVSLSDKGAPVDMVALVVRTDQDGSTAFWFVDVMPGEAERLVARAQQRSAR